MVDILHMIMTMMIITVVMMVVVVMMIMMIMMMNIMMVMMVIRMMMMICVCTAVLMFSTFQIIFDKTCFGHTVSINKMRVERDGECEVHITTYLKSNTSSTPTRSLSSH